MSFKPALKLKHQEARFWSFVKVSLSRKACWEWTKSRNPVTGYGQATAFGGSGGIKRGQGGVHRLAYRLFKGEIPSGLFVCHSCDNKNCCNPFHLFLGTQAENLADARGKGRMAKKLTVPQVRKIRALAKKKVPYAKIAARFGLGVTGVSSIVKRKTWKHVP